MDSTKREPHVSTYSYHGQFNNMIVPTGGTQVREESNCNTLPLQFLSVDNFLCLVLQQ